MAFRQMPPKGQFHRFVTRNTGGQVIGPFADKALRQRTEEGPADDKDQGPSTGYDEPETMDGGTHKDKPPLEKKKEPKGKAVKYGHRRGGRKKAKRNAYDMARGMM